MKKRLFGFVIGLQSILCGQTIASEYVGKINEILIRDDDGLVWVVLGEGVRTGALPACATKGYMMIKNENSATGKRQLALLMIAHTNNRTVYIEGAQKCSRWGDGEDINLVSIRK
ncbi:hypothetical protein [Acinetobacter sp.]|jgi:hypothetical protein|uniref:hypothetical protein n=1 Tax=Acinetobacter sp. TaxID=472 RepID=UPI002823EB99|nr:hypothetical protein [Acinetobacter sp.]MDR0237796.1 hypothetical protein [Acinetobacter sp.]